MVERHRSAKQISIVDIERHAEEASKPRELPFKKESPTKRIPPKRGHFTPNLKVFVQSREVEKRHKRMKKKGC